MRVTTRMMSDLGIDRMNDRLAKFERAQRDLASGRRIHVASDDVAGMNTALGLRAGLAANRQTQRNIDDASRLIQVAETRLTAATEQLQRARSLLVGANNATANQTSLDAIAAELGTIRDSLESVANSRHQGRYLFAGYADASPVVKGGGGWAYAGDGGEVRRRIGESDVVTVNVRADDVFGFAAGDDVFTMLDDVIADLGAGDISGLGASLDGIDRALDRVLDSRALLGATANRIEHAEIRATSDELDLVDQLSSVEDTDMAAAIMELQIQEVAYQSAQAALSKSLQPSLIQFLR